MSVKFVCGCFYFPKGGLVKLCDSHKGMMDNTQYRHFTIQLFGEIKHGRERQQYDRVDGRTEDST